MKPQWSDNPFPKEGSLQYEVTHSCKAQALNHLDFLREFILTNFSDRTTDLLKISELEEKLKSDSVDRWDFNLPIYQEWREFIDTWDKYYCSFYHTYTLDIPYFLVMGEDGGTPTLEQELMIEHYRQQGYW